MTTSSVSPGDALLRDLAPFSDPATETNLKTAEKTSLVEITRNGQLQKYLLMHEDGSLLARHAGDKKYVSIGSLLASPDFADIRNLVTTQLRIYRDFDIDRLIPPEGEFNSKKLALQTLTRATTPSQRGTPSADLKIMLLDGSAGVGKTSLIKRLLVQRLLSNNGSVNNIIPLLHIDSRGRRLSSLDEVLAQSLQLIRAKFTYDQLPSLIRNGLVQLAIDGFDELVDPEGYRDAWFALKDFFEQTGFGGPIILAGRDTFFDQQEFSENMHELSLPVDIHHVRLTEVAQATAIQWLTENGWQAADLEDSHTSLFLRGGSYTLRPYFLQELASAKGWADIEARNLTPRAYLMERFLDRECKILSEKLSLEEIDLKSHLTTVFEEVAVEMADTESDAVDLSFLQMTTEIAFGDKLSATDIGKLRHKSGSFALLENDPREGFRRFPHTEIKHHFLSSALLRLVVASEPIRFLRRGMVTSDLLMIFGEHFAVCDDIQASTFVTALQRALDREASFDRLFDNAVSLLLTSLVRNVEERHERFSDLHVSNVSLFGDVSACSLERVQIQRLDAAEASLVNVIFKDCRIVHLHVDETTRFSAHAPTVDRLHVKSVKGAVRTLFDPLEISDWIQKHSVDDTKKNSENKEALKLLDRVCRIMLRQHMIKDHEDDQFGKLFRSQYWPEIESILTSANLLERRRNRPVSGANAPFVKIKDPFGILANRGSSANAAIWKKVAAIPG
ncbi:hypothetical protein RE432_00795 [Pusillimonas sp. SM2304]|uniref:hypothetical protein n=1 Tax=Pusillimonas sp. SM2304 TaxID=3073241 RepID=UPI002875E57C|nr:hypothetical protein [Pusillimonas sp. SM2304]MDS1138953.1 hypothetical protein [Pusillimonas sp. SM2304]